MLYSCYQVCYQVMLDANAIDNDVSCEKSELALTIYMRRQMYAID